ncbi:serum amyloid P-component-like [Aulostomus maculatus]
MCQTALFLLLLTAGAAGLQDLSAQMFTFPEEGNTAHVRLMTSRQNFSKVTVCLRSFTDLKRDHSLFSLATPSVSDGFLIYWEESTQEFRHYINGVGARYRQEDYKPNAWHSICSTWDSSSGLSQLWFDGKPSIKKFLPSRSTIDGYPIILLGQEQDSHGGAFETRQAFVGMISDVHMWDYILSPCEIQKYVVDLNYTPGNVLNWGALDFQIVGRVLIENNQTTCH